MMMVVANGFWKSEDGFGAPMRMLQQNEWMDEKEIEYSI
jgi:hypothetical protein